MKPPEELRDAALHIFHTALQRCDLRSAMARKLRVHEVEGRRVLHLGAEVRVPLDGITRVLVLAVGKGAAPMLDAVLELEGLPEGCEREALLVAPVKPVNLPAGVQFIPGSHPLPAAHSFNAARTALTMLRTASASPQADETLCLFLISGGASAMMELPLDETVILRDTEELYRALVHSGASIAEINCVRKHFSAVKGGRLAQAAGNMCCVTLLVSDVASGQLDALGSGPTVPDTSTLADCYGVLARYGLLARLPAAVQAFFESGMVPETPKPGDLHGATFSLLSSDDLVEQARAAAIGLGFRVVVDSSCDDWEYDHAADFLLRRLREEQALGSPVCLLSAGEVTVHVPASSHAAGSAGGRNQHFALYAAMQMAQQNDPFVVLSAGSDGIDGNSPAAGAVIDARMLGEASGATGRGSGTSDDRWHAARLALSRFDSYPFLRDSGASIVTGPTGNNLRDLRILLAR